MKKILFMFGAAALFASACTMEIVDPQSQPVGEPSSIVFTAGVETRTTLVPDTDGDETVNHQIHWVSGDKINIDGVEFSTTDDGAKAYFTTESAFDEDNDYVAVYPASAGVSFDEITVPWEQSAVKGNFNSAAVVSVAKTTTTSLDFKNLTSILKFQVPVAAETVTLTSDVCLAGVVSVNYNEGEPEWVEVDGMSSVTVIGPFETGVDYFVAVLPGEKANFKVSIDGNVSRTASTVNAKRSMVMNMGILPEPIGEGIFINSSGEYEISTESGLFKFADMVKAGNTFKGKTVKLTADIEMTQPWTPIGNETDGVNKSFMGTFDGQNNTISNLVVKAEAGAGFFGFKWAGDVLNVKFDKAAVESNHYAGVVVGWADGANYNSKFQIAGCEVTNSTVTLSAEYVDDKWDNGDKAGAIVGYAYAIVVSGNNVSDTDVKGYRDLGGIAGIAVAYESGSYQVYAEVTENVVGDNVTVTVDNTHNCKNYTTADQHNVNHYVGRVDDKTNAKNVIESNKGEAKLVLPVYRVERELGFTETSAKAFNDKTFTAPKLTGKIDGVTYTSSNTSVATVDASTGEVTLVAAGETIITAAGSETETLFAGEASYTLSVYTKSQFGVIGVNEKWGDSDDIVMYATGQDNFFVAFGVEVTTACGFKVRKAGGWVDDYNFGTTTTATKTANSVIGVYTDGGSGDIRINAGTYDIYFDRLRGQVYIMEPGKSYETVSQPTTTSYYSLAGSFTGGGWDDTLAMNFSGDGIWTNVQDFKAGDKFKIKNKGNWNNSWGADNVYPGDGFVTKDDDGNATVKTAGTYIVGFYKGGNKITLVKK